MANVYLKKNQSCLIVGEDDVEFYIPQMDQDEIVPKHALVVSVLAILLKDDERFRAFLDDKINTLLVPEDLQ